MILLTGATGTVGSALLRRLVAAGTPVRCLVREPKRLGAERVRVQIALGDLADPASFRNALRGVDTVVHLAASTRDQPRGSIEELNAMATHRLVRAAERSSARSFVFFSALGASLQSTTRFFRTKALARQAVESADLDHHGVLGLDHLRARRPVAEAARALLVSARDPGGRIGRVGVPADWADDAADCVMAALDRGRRRGSARFRARGTGVAVLRPDRAHRHAPARRAGARSCTRPCRWSEPLCARLRRVTGGAGFATPEEAELMEEGCPRHGVPPTPSRSASILCG